MKLLFVLTNSQRIAILSALLENWTCQDDGHSESFIDCSTNPPTEVSVGDLLQLFNKVDRSMIVPEEVPGDPT